MNGKDDRGDFYKFWYDSVTLGPGEEVLASWKVLASTGALGLQWRGLNETARSGLRAIWGNLLITNRRLIFEPPSDGKRLAFGPTKSVVNKLTDDLERKTPAVATAVQLTRITIEPRDEGEKVTLLVHGPSGTAEYAFLGRIGNRRERHVERRDAAASRIREAAANAHFTSYTATPGLPPGDLCETCHGHPWYRRFSQARLEQLVPSLDDAAYACLRRRLGTERNWTETDLRTRVDPLRRNAPSPQ